MSIAFLLTTLVIVAAPGTGAIYTIASGLTGGTRTSLVAALGCTLGIVPHMIAAISGLAALLHASASAFQTIKWFGVVYLIYMAWSMFRENGTLQFEGHQTVKTHRQVIGSAVLINLLNPKLSIFFFAFLPQFVGTGQGDGLAVMLNLSLTFMAVTFVVFALYGVLAARLRLHVVSKPAVQRWMREGFAVAFAALAARLAYATE